MYPGQEFGRRLSAASQDRHFVLVSSRLQPCVSLPTIGMNYTARLDHLADERLQTESRGVEDSTQSNATSPSPVFFASHSNQSLSFCPSAALPLFQAAYVGLVHFHSTLEPITAWSHHGPTKLVQPGPGSEVAPQSQNALQPQGTGSVLLRRYPPDRPKPQDQWFARVLKNRPGRQRCLMLASRADQKIALGCPSRPSLAAWTHKAFRPTKLHQVRSTCLLSSESGFQFAQGSRVVLHNRLPQHIESLESTEYPNLELSTSGSFFTMDA